jgi:hypothetical protein
VIANKHVCARKKEATRSISRNMVANGSIAPPKSCADCGEREWEQIHHMDYLDPKNIAFLCGACHRERHKDDWKTERNRGADSGDIKIQAMFPKDRWREFKLLAYSNGMTVGAALGALIIGAIERGRL